MKHTILYLSLVFGTAFSASAQDKKKLLIEEVPADIISYVQKHFPQNGIKKAYLDAEDVQNINYDIVLKDKTELEFNQKCKLEEIESKKGIASDFIPKDILTYVAENYPGQIIVEWSIDKEEKIQEIKLKNKTELKFNTRGKFISAEH